MCATVAQPIESLRRSTGTSRVSGRVPVRLSCVSSETCSTRQPASVSSKRVVMVSLRPCRKPQPLAELSTDHRAIPPDSTVVLRSHCIHAGPARGHVSTSCSRWVVRERGGALHLRRSYAQERGPRFTFVSGALRLSEGNLYRTSHPNHGWRTYRLMPESKAQPYAWANPINWKSKSAPNLSARIGWPVSGCKRAG